MDQFLRTKFGQLQPWLNYVVADHYCHEDVYFSEHNDAHDLWGGRSGDSVIAMYTLDAPGIFIITPATSADECSEKAMKHHNYWGRGPVNAIYCPPNSCLWMGGNFQSQLTYQMLPHTSIVAIANYEKQTQGSISLAEDTQRMYRLLKAAPQGMHTVNEYMTWCRQNNSFTGRCVLTMRHVVNHDWFCAAKQKTSNELDTVNKLLDVPPVIYAEMQVNYFADSWIEQPAEKAATSSCRTDPPLPDPLLDPLLATPHQPPPQQALHAEPPPITSSPPEHINLLPSSRGLESPFPHAKRMRLQPPQHEQRLQQQDQKQQQDKKHTEEPKHVHQPEEQETTQQPPKHEHANKQKTAGLQNNQGDNPLRYEHGLQEHISVCRKSGIDIILEYFDWLVTSLRNDKHQLGEVRRRAKELLTRIPHPDPQAYQDKFLECLPHMLNGLISSLDLNLHASELQATLWSSSLRACVVTLPKDSKRLIHGQATTGAFRVIMPAKDVLAILSNSLRCILPKLSAKVIASNDSSVAPRDVVRVSLRPGVTTPWLLMAQTGITQFHIGQTHWWMQSLETNLPDFDSASTRYQFQTHALPTWPPVIDQYMLAVRRAAENRTYNCVAPRCPSVAWWQGDDVDSCPVVARNLIYTNQTHTSKSIVSR